MSDVAGWLDARLPAMPAQLRRAVDAALARSPGIERGAGAEVSTVLADAGMAALGRVAGAGSPADRSVAVELLAADALLTYAFEAAAEAGPAALEHLTGDLDFGRFHALLEEATP